MNGSGRVLPFFGDRFELISCKHVQEWQTNVRNIYRECRHEITLVSFLVLFFREFNYSLCCVWVVGIVVFIYFFAQLNCALKYLDGWRKWNLQKHDFYPFFFMISIPWRMKTRVIERWKSLNFEIFNLDDCRYWLKWPKLALLFRKEFQVSNIITHFKDKSN